MNMLFVPKVKYTWTIVGGVSEKEIASKAGYLHLESKQDTVLIFSLENANVLFITFVPLGEGVKGQIKK